MNEEREPTPETDDQTDAGREQRLAVLLEAMIASSRERQPVALEEALRENPDLAEELRELWATIQIAEEFGSHSGLEQESDGGIQPDSATELAADGLPRRIGDYELLEELGRGGMGVVYKARQTSLGRMVAVKMILQGEWASPSDVARFRTEAESAARLNHPHIVRVFEVGEHAGRPFFSMQLIEGSTLAQRLADGPLPPRQAAELLAPVCRALADAHELGVLHRDLKPSNILIDNEGRPYVTDFGLAKRFTPQSETDAASAQLTSLTQSGAILGTPSYMAPEQAAGRRGHVSAATDVYALGAILYAAITGRAPFQAASPVDTVLMVLEQDPAPPRLVNPQADPALEMIVLKCLQKPSDLRYDSASALADDLDAYLAHEPISARSGRFSQVISQAFRETHHAAVLENWGLLWMWHSLVLLILCFTTNWFQYQGIGSRWPYLALWVVGLGIWAGIFWQLRRRAGPITFVERQVAHIWAGSVAASTLLYAVEWLLDMPVLRLSPVLGLVSGTVFLVKAGILTGTFYFQAAALFLTGLMMAAMQRAGEPNLGLSLFGIVSAACFFVPGYKYYRRRMQTGSSTGD